MESDLLPPPQQSHKLEVRNKIVEIARSKINLPFQHQGRNPDIALDCVGLLTYIVDQLGIDYDDVFGYPRTPYDRTIIKALDHQKCLQRIKVKEHGCIIILRITRQPQHAAIYDEGKNTIIHSCATMEKVIEQEYVKHFVERTARFYRIVV